MLSTKAHEMKGCAITESSSKLQSCLMAVVDTHTAEMGRPCSV